MICLGDEKGSVLASEIPKIEDVCGQLVPPLGIHKVNTKASLCFLRFSGQVIRRGGGSGQVRLRDRQQF